MKSLSFRKDLIGVQDELLRFAYKLTTDREEANDLLQETSFPFILPLFWTWIELTRKRRRYVLAMEV